MHILKRNRAGIYEVIDRERDYQDRNSENPACEENLGNGDRTLDEFVLYISGRASDLASYSSNHSSKYHKLDKIRKIAALCVHAMEQHGAVNR